MTYYADLSDYEYFDHDRPLLNVGWLGKEHDFPTGEVPSDVVERLVLLADEPENILRGMHQCEFCTRESPIRLRVPSREGYVVLGTGEIWVERRGIAYSAPTLVVHYIIDHHYLPPAEFLEAVVATAEA